MLGGILSTCLISSEPAKPYPGVAVQFAFQSSMRLAFPYAPHNLTADLKTADLVPSLEPWSLVSKGAVETLFTNSVCLL